jgi:hypothetical protein
VNGDEREWFYEHFHANLTGQAMFNIGGELMYASGACMSGREW